jgi:hypothetical protein
MIVRMVAGQKAFRLARALLVLLALALPFEAPLFRVGPLQITSVELVLYAVLASWMIATAAEVVGGRRALADLQGAVANVRGDGLAMAAVLWCVVLFASAAATADRGPALKFVLRSLSGVLVFFAARALARPPEVRRRVLQALVAGALLSAASAAVEALVPQSASLWRLFRQGDFVALGLPRASGVFGYPTIGAMYWEAAVPLLVVTPFVGPGARRGVEGMRAIALAWLGCALLVGAILASATRSGLAGTAIACLALVGLTGRMGLAVRQAAAGSLGVLSVSLALALVTTTPSPSLLSQRLRWWRDGSWFGVEYRAQEAPHRVRVGEPFTVPVTLRNTGTLPWPHSGDHPTHLAYHWERVAGSEPRIDAAGTALEIASRADFEGRRTELPADVPPGGVLEVVAMARGPDAAGAYRLRWDLVQEHVTWFSERGNAMPRHEIEVLPGADEAPATARPPEDPTPFVLHAPAPPVPRRDLWRAALVLWRESPLLGVGPDCFRRRYEAVLSPAPNGQPYTDTRLHANSLYFETLADLGLAGIGALGAMAFALGRRVREHCLRGGLAGLGCGVAAGAFFVHGLFDYFLEFTPLLGLFWLLLGLTASHSPDEPESAGLPGNPG